jgi:hypothetical protein
MICRECKLNRQRIDSGRVSSRGKVFVDETGRQWNGKQGPCCKYGKKAAKTKVGRKCDCGRHMDATRYFACTKCKPVLEPDGEFTNYWW